MDNCKQEGLSSLLDIVDGMSSDVEIESPPSLATQQQQIHVVDSSDDEPPNLTQQPKKIKKCKEPTDEELFAMLSSSDEEDIPPLQEKPDNVSSPKVVRYLLFP